MHVCQEAWPHKNLQVISKCNITALSFKSTQSYPSIKAEVFILYTVSESITGKEKIRVTVRARQTDSLYLPGSDGIRENELFSKTNIRRPIKLCSHRRRVGQQNGTEVWAEVVYVRSLAGHCNNLKCKAGRETAPNVLDLVVKKIFDVCGTSSWVVEVGGSGRRVDHS